MKKTGVFYGSTTGTTESVARTIAEKLGIPSSDVYNVSKMTADVARSYTRVRDKFCSKERELV